MTHTLGVALAAEINTNEDELPGIDPLHALAERLRAEMQHGRDHVAIVVPGVTLRMMAFYHKSPDAN